MLVAKKRAKKGHTDFQSSALQCYRELGKHKDTPKLAPEQKLMQGQSEQKKDIAATKQKKSPPYGSVHDNETAF